MRVIPSQVSSSLTAQIGPLDGPTLPKPIYASGGGGGTSLPMPYSVWWEESMTPPQPHPQHTRPEITETTVPRGGHTYSSHRHYSSYDRRALRPVGGLPTVEQGAWQASGGASGGNYEAVRADTQQQQLEAEELEEEGGLFADMGGFPTVEESTWQASGGAYGRNCESVQADAQQQQLEAEELEEEEGMLADLLKGGLKIKDIFPNGKPPYK
ncbi:hypothetical protein EMWEY_00060380 [Eimeria maxima]|uniref:Uncharacterized protein n=1 Tax=Eimeria maxima TaxID=5804 RepID=U6M8E0_EIMMA|nr:hypothetical protein EMWEY_00060380 [Eimeria maxima]CDJ60291.1 hypothetical protein EMWEY_00060380 [Eimeria maxima]